MSGGPQILLLCSIMCASDCLCRSCRRGRVRVRAGSTLTLIGYGQQGDEGITPYCSCLALARGWGWGQDAGEGREAQASFWRGRHGRNQSRFTPDPH